VTAAYVAAVDWLRWLMDALEVLLDSLPDGAAVEPETARGKCLRRPAMADDTTAAPDAPAGACAGRPVQLADGPRVGLCAAFPLRLAGAVGAALRGRAEDLCDAVVDLVGARPYLRTVSFATSGLRSRVASEALTQGETARRLSEMVEAVLPLARPATVGPGA